MPKAADSPSPLQTFGAAEKSTRGAAPSQVAETYGDPRPYDTRSFLAPSSNKALTNQSLQPSNRGAPNFSTPASDTMRSSPPPGMAPKIPVLFAVILLPGYITRRP